MGASIDKTAQRVLVTIPHFFGPGEKKSWGTSWSGRDERVKSVRTTLESLAKNLAPESYELHLGSAARALAPKGQEPVRGGFHRPLTIGNQVDIRVLYVEGHSLWEEAAQRLGGMVRGVAAKNLTDTRNLGFLCHRVHKNNLGDYDWHIYLEDDLVLHDPETLNKLRWFTNRFGPECMLIPNRFEYSPTLGRKLYVDGDLTTDRKLISTTPKVLKSQIMGISRKFWRPNNPHSGFWAMSREQLEMCAEHPNFGVYRKNFVSPLESAAVAPVFLGLDMYKPAPENPAFFEIEHIAQRFMPISEELSRRAG